MDPCCLFNLGLPLVESTPKSEVSSLENGLTTCTAIKSEIAEHHINGCDPIPRSLTSRAKALADSMCRPIPVHRPEFEMSIVSFNMLLKGFEHKQYYRSIPPELRSWSYRKPMLQSLLFGLDADIFCMQEVEVASFEEDFAFLEQGGYAAVAPKADKGSERFQNLTKCSIFFKSKRFELEWSENRSRTVLAALRHLPTGHLVYVVSCHLEGHPSEAAARLSQTKSALERLRLDQVRRNLKPADCVVVFAGDFNGEEDSAVCHFLSSGCLRKDFRDPWVPDKELVKADISHEFQLVDLYANQKRRPPTFCAPNDHGGRPSARAIDFFFFSPGHLRPVSLRQPFDEAQLAAACSEGIPSDWHISDHVPIGGVFAFSKSEGEPLGSLKVDVT